MNAVDTNVLARFLLHDDQAQAERAADVLRAPVWVSLTVWLELGWVLGKQLKLKRGVISDALETLLALDTIHTGERAGLLWAVDRFRAGADWADMIHLVAGGSADRFTTFDGQLARQAGASTLLPVESLS